MSLTNHAVYECNGRSDSFKLRENALFGLRHEALQSYNNRFSSLFDMKTFDGPSVMTMFSRCFKIQANHCEQHLAV